MQKLIVKKYDEKKDESSLLTFIEKNKKALDVDDGGLFLSKAKRPLGKDKETIRLLLSKGGTEEDEILGFLYCTHYGKIGRILKIFFEKEKVAPEEIEKLVENVQVWLKCKKCNFVEARIPLKNKFIFEDLKKIGFVLWPKKEESYLDVTKLLS